MADSSVPKKIRIAISGGGLAGAAVANALFHQPHLEVDIYESASEFSEHGAAIALAINAQRALVAIIPEADDLLARAGAVPMHSTRLLIGSGPTAGTKVMDIGEEYPSKIVHRAAFLRELLSPLPKASLHPNKKLVKIETIDTAAPGEHLLRLNFQDGSTTNADALVGADGIFGSVRQHVLGPDSPVLKPTPAGWARCINLVPFEKAKAKLGEEFFKEDRQYGWIGDGGLILHDVLNNREMVQCVGTGIDKVPSSERKKTVTRDTLEETFASWLDGPVAKGMIDLLLDQKDPAAYAQWEHQNAPTYLKGCVCIAGDAAHAMTPWQASGAATALEDAVVLGHVFSAVDTADGNQMENALKAYDTVRRPRTQRIAESSKMTGFIMSGRGEGIGVDAEKMREALASRWKFIHEFDLEAHKREALDIMMAL